LKPVEESPALRFGTVIHDALALHYSGLNAFDHIDAFYAKVLESRLPFDTEEVCNEWETAKIMMSTYKEIYPVETFVVVDTERIYPRYVGALQGDDIYFAGRVDMIIAEKDDGLGLMPFLSKNYWLMEHKTTSVLDDRYIERLELDPQITGYLFLMSSEYDDVIGVQYNILRKPSIKKRQNESYRMYWDRLRKDYSKRPEFYFRRCELVRNEDEMREFPEYVLNIAREIKIGEYARNTSRCNLYGRCEFRPLCIEWSDELASTYAKKKTENEELLDD
jgi:hypothetical protein